MSPNVDIKKVCIYGVGGVGGYFGGLISNAINNGNATGVKCYFIARGDHLAAIKHAGIEVITPDKTIAGRPAIATDDIHEIPDPDLLLLCVKSYDLDHAVDAIGSKVNANTIVIPLLNGADIYDRIRTRLTGGIVLPACVYVGTHIDLPGVIRQSGGDGRILFGKDPAFDPFSPDAVTRFLDCAGVNYQWNDDPFPAIWEKYIFIAAFGLVTVFSGQTLGEILEDTEAKELVRVIMGEIRAIAAAKGIDLSENIIAASVAKANHFPPETKTSYQRDVETKGHVNEGDLYGGTIIREGSLAGVPTPVTQRIFSAIESRFNR